MSTKSASNKKDSFTLNKNNNYKDIEDAIQKAIDMESLQRKVKSTNKTINQTENY